VPQGNLLKAPTPVTPWDSGSFAGTQATVTRDTTVTCAGQPSLRLEGPGHFYAQTTSARVPVDPRLTYRLTTQMTTQALDGIVEQDVFWYGADGAQLEAWGEAIGGRLRGTHPCTPVSGTIQPPAGAVQAVVQYRVLADGGQAWVSGMTLEAVAPAGIPAPQETPPAAPQPLVAVPAAVPTVETLLAEFETLTTDYTRTQAQIRAAYEQTLQQTRSRPARAHAYQEAQTALTTAYRTMVETWAQLFEQYVTLLLTPAAP
jgi:hypothetical protein